MKEHFIYPGYKIENGKVVVYSKEAEVVKKIFEKYRKGKSAYVITNELNEEGIKTFSNAKEWYHTAVLKILRNNVYIGNEIYPEIIDKSLFLDAKNKAKVITKKMKNQNHSLYKNIYCKNCGSAYCLYYSRKKEIYYWTCPKTKVGGKKACNCDGITEKEVSKTVINAINTLLQNPSEVDIVQVSDNFFNEAEYKQLNQRFIQEVKEKKEMSNLLELAQQKLQAEYEGYKVVDHMYLYKKLLAILRDNKCISHLSQKIVDQVIHNIEIDAKDKLIIITLINRQEIVNRYKPVSYCLK